MVVGHTYFFDFGNKCSQEKKVVCCYRQEYITSTSTDKVSYVVGFVNTVIRE